jgi:hypothetical protein
MSFDDIVSIILPCVLVEDVFRTGMSFPNPTPTPSKNFHLLLKHFAQTSVQPHIQTAVSQQEVLQLLRDQLVDLMTINCSFAEVTFMFERLTFMPTPPSSSSSKTPHWPCEQGAKNASHNREGSNNDVHFGVCCEVAAEESCEKSEQLEKPFAMYRLN